MKNNNYKLEIISTFRTLSVEEQEINKEKLRYLKEYNGVISLCLESNAIYLEFDPLLFSLEVFKLMLKDIGFPMVEDMKYTSLHYNIN